MIFIYLEQTPEDTFSGNVAHLKHTVLNSSWILIRFGSSCILHQIFMTSADKGKATLWPAYICFVFDMSMDSVSDLDIGWYVCMFKTCTHSCHASASCRMLYEPQHDKTNKVTVHPAKTQISLGIHPVWSESSLSPWRKLGSLAAHWAHSEGSDQTGRMPRLIGVFTGRTVTLLVLSCRGSWWQLKLVYIWHNPRLSSSLGFHHLEIILAFYRLAY